ncbi:hypothetical protein KQX54_004437 [Cotesia glomerata]|uniref:Uncharacterized protein n=1 Tax=Cotesia glomerata TaxID=32391 RepID=A0AAV7HYW8_COTGL|nr:hypothetical protein KQX54_004437 [Cotesia glomerata]
MVPSLRKIQREHQHGYESNDAHLEISVQSKSILFLSTLFFTWLPYTPAHSYSSSPDNGVGGYAKIPTDGTAYGQEPEVQQRTANENRHSRLDH